MKHTQKTLSFLVVMVLISVLFVGCGNIFGSSSSSSSDDVGGDGSLGESFTLPAGPIDYLPGNAEIALAFLNVPGEDSSVHFYNPVNVSDGNFPGMEITAPSSEYLVDWNIFFEEGLGDSSFLNVSDANAKLQILFELAILKDTDLIEENVVGFIERTDDQTFEVFWMYSDRNVQINGSVDVGDPEDPYFTFTAQLNLRKGWNRVIDSLDPATDATMIRTGSEPSGVGWYFFVDDDD